MPPPPRPAGSDPGHASAFADTVSGLSDLISMPRDGIALAMTAEMIGFMNFDVVRGDPGDK